MLRPFSLQFNSRESWWHSWTVWGMNAWPIWHIWGSHGQPNRQRGSVLFFDSDCSFRAIDHQEGNRTGLCVLPALLQQHAVLQWNGRIWSEREARRPAVTNSIHFSTSMCISEWSPFEVKGWFCIDFFSTARGLLLLEGFCCCRMIVRHSETMWEVTTVETVLRYRKANVADVSCDKSIIYRYISI